ncbi:hypothetical protein RRG08_013524 [Elysia crispata]|uniref:Uncharacterized protein n=1 Tax=Elysia crispata TaxID=231223 RepID=A0AAE0Y130_9GAST|nr:hypothetical protein RRG08_013524 [Elysia crispata]
MADRCGSWRTVEDHDRSDPPGSKCLQSWRSTSFSAPWISREKGGGGRGDKGAGAEQQINCEAVSVCLQVCACVVPARCEWIRCNRQHARYWVAEAWLCVQALLLSRD